MAVFNENVVDTDALDVKTLRCIGMELQGFLSDEEYNQIRIDWNEANTRCDKDGNTYKLIPKDEGFIPLWKFCLENISVSYKKGL